MIFDPSEHLPQDMYKLLVGTVVPRPIALVSTLDTHGTRNLAPFSFFTVASANPPIICFCPMIRRTNATRKDTLNNIEAAGECVVHVVTDTIARQVNAASAEVPPDVDEFSLSGLTPIPSDRVKPPRVKESPIAMECTLRQIIHVSPLPLGGSIVVVEVVRFHIADALVQDFRIDPAGLDAVGRMGGPTWVRTRDRFDRDRPK